MPDVYVPVDTTWRSDFYNKLLRKGTFSRFTLKYVNERRLAFLQQYPTLEVFVQRFKVDETLWNDFLAYAESKGVKSEESYKNSMKSMETQLKAMIAQYLFDSKAYYRIINELKPIYNEAVEIMMDNKQFSELGIVGK
jgi:carboxyl-terminal processing protease